MTCKLLYGGALALAVFSLFVNDAAAQFTPFNEPPVAVDVNPDPRIVEVFIEAREDVKQYSEGVDTAVWTFNGTVPGPTIKANVGDTLIVHFTNNLPEDTTIHWHGLETPAEMDGAHISQLAVPANGGTFDYEFDLLTAALFWYHPHVKTNEQVEKGLHGALLVRDPAEDAALGLPVVNRIMILDDVLLDENGQVEDALPGDPVGNVETILNGRLGNQLLINGLPTPIDYGTPVGGVAQRWRIVNVSNSRFWRLSFPENQSVYRIGGDGGLLESPQLKESIEIIPTDPPPGDGPGDHTSNSDPEQGIFLTPGERADVVLTPRTQSQATVRVENHDWHKGNHIVFTDPKTGNILLGDLPGDGAEAPELVMVYVPTNNGPPYTPPDPLREIPALDMGDSSGMLMYMMGHTPPPLPPDGDVKMFIQMAGPMQPLPMPKVNSLEAYDVEVGETYVIQVVNMSHGDHPFHTHGFFFQPFEIEIQDDVEPENNQIIPIPYLENKDTFRVPARPREELGTSRTIMRALVKFDDTGREGRVRAEGLYPTEDESGGWLTHCHVLEHSANGMMTFTEVRYPGQTFSLLGNGLAGTNGIPVLRGTSDLTPGASFDLTLRNAAASASTTLIVGASLLNAPFKGGQLIPSPDFLLPFNTDGNGEVALSTTWPNGIPGGVVVYYQFWTVDGAGPKGLSASNAISSTTP